jgi:hypothetical protein
MPIDIAAFWYHWSALKTARLDFSFAGRARERVFLALVDLEVIFFDIFPPASHVPLSYLSRASVAVTRGCERGRVKKASSDPHHNILILQ